MEQKSQQADNNNVDLNHQNNIDANEEEVLSIQYLLDNPSLLQAPQSTMDKSKEDKLVEPNVNDLPSAYLGPQIWNDMLLSDDLKLEPVDLDDLFDNNVVNEEGSDLSIFMAPDSSPNNLTSSSPHTKPSQQSNEGTNRSNNSHQQAHQYKLGPSPPQQLYGQSPVSSQAHSPSEYLASNTPTELINRRVRQQNEFAIQQNSPTQLQTKLPSQHRLIQNQINEAKVQQRRLSTSSQQQRPIQVQQYPIFRPPYSQHQPIQQRSPSSSNYMFDYSMLSPSSDHRRKSSPTSPAGSGGYASPLQTGRKRSHESGCSDSPSAKVKAISPSYQNTSDQIASIRIPSPVKVNFVVNDADVMISTPRKRRNYSSASSFFTSDVNLQEEGDEDEYFDPSTRAFSQEELKPQPIIRKSRKTFVPPDNKDVKYWNRRKKNNVAAKRSREARRIKENQIALRASYLEQENLSLKAEITDLRRELGRAVDLLRTYESAFPNFSTTNFVVSQGSSPSKSMALYGNENGGSPTQQQQAHD